MGRSTYLYQIPGPLTDSMFYENPRQATRSRNYFNPDIYIPSVQLKWLINSTTQVDWLSSAVLGERNSVQFVGFADVVDAIDPATKEYAPRQVDIDRFNSYSSELRFRKDYVINGVGQTLVLGIRYVDNDMHRRQQGKGSTGTDFDLSLASAGFGRDLHHRTRNVSLFAENVFNLSPKLSLSPGIRIETGESNMSGKISYIPDEQVPLKQIHDFVLFGISGKYSLDERHTLYGGWSQAYRPIVMADIIPPTALDRTDESLKDSFGYNAEVGIRGGNNRLTYDLSLFRLNYNNRVGTVLVTDEPSPYLFKTNTGNSKTLGLELFAEYELVQSPGFELSLFTATSYFDAEYIDSQLGDGDQNIDISGNSLETVPNWMSRNGLQLAYQKLTGIFQHTYVGKSYSDAFNTQNPSANGAKGLVPAYHIFDLNLAYRYSLQLLFKAGVNNLFDQSYFTKRPAGYPGAGVWPSDGRGVNFSVAFNL